MASTCRGTAESVRLTVSPKAVDSAEQPGIAVSFVVPDGEAVREPCSIGSTLIFIKAMEGKPPAVSSPRCRLL